MVQQKIVIKVEMACDKCRSKAMALVAANGGVDSVAIAGDGRDQVVVVGDGVDAIELTSALRRKVGPAQLLQVGDAKKKEDDKKPPAAAAAVAEYPWYYHYPPPQPAAGVVYEYERPAAGYGYAYGYQSRQPDNTCSIM
ncbi:hypothetical protein ACP70R_026743 [Stipagrostis hirtigluma subsp. patula]